MIVLSLFLALLFVASLKTQAAVPRILQSAAPARNAAGNQKQPPSIGQNSGACAKFSGSPGRAPYLEELKRLYAAGRWKDVVCLTPIRPGDPAEIDYYRGMALARLKRWALAKESF
ncbi:MAG TPA: hypothetical protein VGX94_12555, partial [Terriglobia bacterium]|nr:hypothetical protein [Terriglobia bacterium]